MSGKQLSVRLYGKPVGVLEQTQQGQLAFTYDNTQQALSIGMPITELPYGNRQCEAFFGGLLPESMDARRAIGLRFGISPNNTFSILKAIGYDCAGAVSFHSVDDPILEHSHVPITGRILDDEELAQHIQELPKKPLFIGVDGLRLSLAGAQEKAAVCLINGRVAIPHDGTPTTHILKPAIPTLPNTVENEYLCMRVAARLGLTVPNVEIRYANNIPYLLVERYDRTVTPDNRIQRIHQEDFCQALGILSTHKYQSEGGPSLKDCFDLLRLTSSPVRDRNQLAKLLVFNYLIGNTDAHGKNFSLLHKSANEVQLSPVYDVLCTQIYPQITSKMSMKIGSKYEIDYVEPRHWEELCSNIQFSLPTMRDLLRKQLVSIESLIKVDMNISPSVFETGTQILKWFSGQYKRTAKRFNWE